MNGSKQKKKPTRAEVNENAKQLIVKEVARAYQKRDEELRAYVKTLEARMWYGVSSAVLIGLAWIIYELIKL